MIPRDKYGWPVERVIGRPALNAILMLIHTNLRQTWRWRDPVHDDGIRALPLNEVGSCVPTAAHPAKGER